MALGGFRAFKKVSFFLVFKPGLLWFLFEEAKVVREPVGKESFFSKTMHLNTVFRKLLFFGESTK